MSASADSYRDRLRQLRWRLTALNKPLREADKRRLVAYLREHALTIGDFELASGRRAKYYVDAKRAVLTPEGAELIGRLTAAEAWRLGATSIGGMTMGADPVVCAALGAGANVNAFFVRKEKKDHGMQRWIEGPDLRTPERCLVVDDVVTTGGSVVQAIERLKEAGVEIVGVLAILDRLAGGKDAIDAATGGVPYLPLTTIDDVYPDRPDRS